MKVKIPNILLIILFSAVLFLLGKNLTSDTGDSLQLINEVCCSNFNLLQDENGNYPDYIELWNPTDEVLSLENYYLSDDSEKLDKYSLADITLEPKQYQVLFMDGSSNQEADREGFKLSRNGEELYLYQKDKRKICQIVSIPETSYNKAYGRKQSVEEEQSVVDIVMDAGNWRSESRSNTGQSWAMMDATPGYANVGAKEYPLVKLSQPTFSVESGFYKEAFELELKASAGEQIYYTLDGSDPTKDSLLYEGPIYIEDATKHENVYAMRTDLSPTSDYVPDYLIDKATVVKAFVYDPGENVCSKMVTKTYFVGFDEKEEYRDMAIMSLTIDPDKLFDPETGIYTNGITLEQYKENGGLQDGELLGGFTDEDGNQWNLYEASNAFYTGKEWEREGTITYFDENHDAQFTQNVGLRIAGASTRGTPQKSFKLYGRSVYDTQVEFPYEFFDNTTYSSIKLRNGGSNNAAMKMLDAFVESLVEDRAVAIQRAKPVVLFLNGEYWGLYNIRERYTAEYVQNYYGVDKNNVWIIDAETSQEGGQSALDAYFAMKEFVEQNDMSNPEIYRMVTEQIDMQSLIEYLCINFFLKNEDIDWNQNVALWRTAEPEEGEYGDCKWRYMFFDADECLNDYDPEESVGGMDDFYLFQTPFVQSLFRNEQFRTEFGQTMLEMMDTTFDYNLVHQELMEWQELYHVQTIETGRRFFAGEYSEERYQSKVERMDKFLRERKEFLMEDLRLHGII